VYAKTHSVEITKSDGSTVNVYQSYLQELSSNGGKSKFDELSSDGGKSKFDMFLRGKRDNFGKFTTNHSQINFFKWAYDNEVIAYCQKNGDAIVQDMREQKLAHI
jgi:hypothetical protein